MATPHEFFLETINRKIDTDGVPKGQPYQCVDLFKYWLKHVQGVNIGSVCPQTGYAKDIWTCFDQLGLGQWFDKVPTNQMVDGDWAIWNSGSSSPDCRESHVAMFRVDNKNGTGTFLGQNQGVAYVNQKSIRYAGMFGALRPKIYHKPIQTSEKVDQILHKGSKVQIPGTFEVVDINVKENTALVRIDGKDYWLSSTPLKEV